MTDMNFIRNQVNSTGSQFFFKSNEGLQRQANKQDQLGAMDQSEAQLLESKNLDMTRQSGKSKGSSRRKKKDVKKKGSTENIEESRDKINTGESDVVNKDSCCG